MFRGLVFVLSLGFVCAGPYSTSEASADSISDLTGSRVRLVWVKGKFRDKIVGYDTADGKTRVIRSGIGEGGAVRPLLTDDGKRIVYSTGGDVGDFGTTHRVYIIGWDGSDNKKISDNGYLSSLWTDPKSGVEYAVAMRKDRKTYDKIPLNNPDGKSVLLAGPSSARAELQLSEDGKRGCMAPSGIGWIDMTQNPPKYHGAGSGCRPSMAPDNSYRWWNFNGNHTSFTMRTSGGSSWNVSIPNSNKEAYYPRWTNHVRYMTHTDNFKNNNSSQVYICRFDSGNVRQRSVGIRPFDRKSHTLCAHRVGKASSLALDDVIAGHIRHVLHRTGGKIHGPGGAGELLAVNPNTLRTKMKKLGIPFKKS